MKQKFIDYFMDVAIGASNLSHAQRRKTGCVIVKDRNILAFGYNGTPEGYDNSCEYTTWDVFGVPKLVTKPEVLHAEENAIAKIARSTQSSDGSTAFITLSPCINCAKLLKNAGVTTVIYKDDYRIMDGVEFLKKCGVQVIKYGSEEMDNLRKL